MISYDEQSQKVRSRRARRVSRQRRALVMSPLAFDRAQRVFSGSRVGIFKRTRSRRVDLTRHARKPHSSSRG